MAYLTTTQTAPLLLEIPTQFEKAARLKPFTPKQAAARWDQLFKKHLAPLGIKYNITDNPKGLSALGTYLTTQHTRLFRATRAANLDAAPALYAEAQAADAKAAADAEAPRTLKKMQMYIKQYIQEIQALQTSGNFSDDEEKYWNRVIRFLKQISKNFENPEHQYSTSILKHNLQLDFNKVGAINTVVLKQWINLKDHGHEANEASCGIQKKLNAIQEKVADFFFLSKETVKCPKPTITKLPIQEGLSPTPLIISKGFDSAFSRILGQPTKPLSSGANVLAKSINTDLEKIRELYAKEIKNMKFKEQNQNDTKNRVLDELSKIQLTVDEINKLNLEETTLAEVVFNKILIQDWKAIINEPELVSLQEKVKQKFLEASAPQKYQKIIKQANQYVEKLESELDKLKLKISEHAESRQRTEFEYNIKHMDGLSKMLASGYHTKPNFLAEMRKEKAIYVKASKEDKKYMDLLNLIEETLKVSDPYYDDIKKLDKYIENLEKDVAKNPPKANEDFSRTSNRQVKLDIAKEVRAMLVNPTFGKTGTEKKAYEQIGYVRKLNTSYTKTLMGKGQLDGILGDILNKLNPDPKRKLKP